MVIENTSLSVNVFSYVHFLMREELQNILVYTIITFTFFNYCREEHLKNMVYIKILKKVTG